MILSVAWVRGGEGRLTALEGERATIASSVSTAPGTPLDGKFGSGAAFRIKVARCRREGEVFVIQGRLVDLSRELRTALLAALADGAKDASGA